MGRSRDSEPIIGILKIQKSRYYQNDAASIAILRTRLLLSSQQLPTHEQPDFFFFLQRIPPGSRHSYSHRNNRFQLPENSLHKIRRAFLWRYFIALFRHTQTSRHATRSGDVTQQPQLFSLRISKIHGALHADCRRRKELISLRKISAVFIFNSVVFHFVTEGSGPVFRISTRLSRTRRCLMHRSHV